MAILECLDIAGTKRYIPTYVLTKTKKDVSGSTTNGRGGVSEAIAWVISDLKSKIKNTITVLGGTNATTGTFTGTLVIVDENIWGGVSFSGTVTSSQGGQGYTVSYSATYTTITFSQQDPTP